MMDKWHIFRKKITVMFKNRIDAAIQLADELKDYKNSDSIILAIPRGGVPLGKWVAGTLNLPLELVLSKKISHPLHKEYAIGAVSLESRVLDDTIEVSGEYIEKETKRLRQLLRERFSWYYKANASLPITGKRVIIIDDGIATGYTMLSTLELIHQHRPKKVILAVPVAPPAAIKRLEDSPYVDQVVSLLIPDNFKAVGQFYLDFHQVSDEEVKVLMGFKKVLG